MRVAIIAAEPSGDLLGAGLMQALLQRVPDIEFEGIGGARMQAVGMRSLEPMVSLSVMGLVEVLQHLPALLRLRRRLRARWTADPPGLFIGVDAPDFNLPLEQGLRQAGVPTVHYVSPTVWAWREGRVRKLRAAVDLLLSIFPFEPAFLEARGVKAVYVGHKLAADMPLEVDRSGARAALGLDLHAPVLAVLPGSRGGEVTRLAAPFAETAAACQEQISSLKVLAPLASEATAAIWQQQQAHCASGLQAGVSLHNSRQVLAAADVVLTASGTATFEALLSKRPMVVGYRLNGLTYAIAKWFRLVRLEHVAMANLLAGEALAPEFIQGGCTPGKLIPAVLDLFHQPERITAIQTRYRQIHEQLAVDSDRLAADAVLELLRRRDAL